jgi:hypothetical protein
MAVKLLTVKQHQEVLKRLLELGKQRGGRVPIHAAGEEYTSLMICFLLHSLSAAESILRLSASFGDEWFPATVGYSIVRPMFEIDVTAHYITKSPAERARQYIDFGAVLNKRKMEACAKHRKSRDAGWREGMELEWQHYWASREPDVNKKFDAVSSQFTRKENPRKGELFKNWSGKSIRKMAEDVDQLESYDVFYGELSSFTHGNVHLADRFLRCRADGPAWSQRSNEFDVGNVLRHAATFLTCYMELFGQQFKTWSDIEVEACWDRCLLNQQTSDGK